MTKSKTVTLLLVVGSLASFGIIWLNEYAFRSFVVVAVCWGFGIAGKKIHGISEEYRRKKNEQILRDLEARLAPLQRKTAALD